MGGAFITEAGNLKFKHIIHIVGPEWAGDGKDDEGQLQTCIGSMLDIC
jgi:O-acetyl-ADP-ribose deacetylase (regulator of RNase III)